MDTSIAAKSQVAFRSERTAARSGRRLRQNARPMLYVFSGGLGILLLLVSFLLQQQMSKVLAITCASLCFNLLSWLIINEAGGPVFVYKLFLCFCWMQPVAFLVICLLFPANVIGFCQSLPIFQEWPASLLASFSLPF